MSEPADLKVCAVWKDDCQGKKDYDGHILRVSSRYWPANYSRDGKSVSANSAILLCHGEPNQYGYGDYNQLISRDFYGSTEADVKRQVEEWAQEQFDKIHKAMLEIYL